MSQLGLKKADGDDGVNDVGHPCSQPGGEVACGGQGGEKLIQEQHGCRQEQRNADAGHGGAPLERDGGGDGNKRQDDAGKFIQAHCDDAGIMVRDACIKKDEKTGRMMMVPVEGSEYTVDADLVLIAAGFLGSQDYVTKAFGVEVNERTNVKTEAGKYSTNVKDVFTAGDMHRGQSLVVWAIREGREVAREVDESLMGYTNLYIQ